MLLGRRRAVDFALKELEDHPDESGFKSPKDIQNTKRILQDWRQEADDALADDRSPLGEKLREMIGPLRSQSRESASGNLYGITQSELKKYLDDDILRFKKPGEIRPSRN